MCWVCDTEAAKKLLADGERVIAEAVTLKKQGHHIISQAHSDMHRALLDKEAYEAKTGFPQSGRKWKECRE
jgi:hypothetical protein